jgi:nucleotide-binding universal stress UspA family protein
MIALNKIVVATDFGDAANVALDYGRELARTFGASLELLHVCDNAFTRLGADGYLADCGALQRDIEAGARQQLDRLLNDEDRAQLKAKAVMMTSNAPALAIVNYAAESRADIIVMGTHGHGAVTHLLVGSVAERVVRLAPCPVLTVRHPEREFIVPDALIAVARA